jgi:hypothetical protein
MGRRGNTEPDEEIEKRRWGDAGKRRHGDGEIRSAECGVWNIREDNPTYKKRNQKINFIYT